MMNLDESLIKDNQSDQTKNLEGRRILCAVSGGIAAYKTVELVRRLLKSGADVRVVMTRSAINFIGPVTFSAITGHEVGIEMFDNAGGAQIPHLDVGHWAELIIVAPATANLLAKMAAGIADDLVSAGLLAAKCPVIAAPAMNESMYSHPATQANLKSLGDRGLIIIGPEYGEMASPEEKPGLGRMSEPEKLADAVLRVFTSAKKLSGKKIVITAGRTEEAIDPVRIITNRSSGRMGVALAKAAWLSGAEVTLIHGPMDLPAPGFLKVKSVRSADEMLEACITEIPQADVVFYAAAVADWKPKAVSDKKLKRENGAVSSIELEENTDIAEKTASIGNGLKIGFALEEKHDIPAAKSKLKRKGLDAILLNDFKALESDRSSLTWIDDSGQIDHHEEAEKDILAEWIIDQVSALLDEKRD